MLSDNDLLTQFEETTLPFDQWNHRAHVRVAYLFLTKYGMEDALNRIRLGIKTYNAAQQVPESLDRGYHETITQAFVHLLNVTIRENGPFSDSQEFCDRCPEMLDKRVLLRFYSKDLLLSWEAKRQFVEPDLIPLPSMGESKTEAQMTRVAMSNPEPTEESFTNTDQLVVIADDANSPAAVGLIAELSAELARRYDHDDDGTGDFRPDEHTHRSVFLVGKLAGEPVACGAIRPLENNVAEVKRMFVKPEFRGRGFSKQILQQLETEARRLGYVALRLETANRQPEAIDLYEGAGYRRIEPFGIYVGSERSVCFEKRIDDFPGQMLALLGNRDPLDVLAATPDVLDQFIQNHSARDLRTRPFKDKWTPNEILGHFVDNEIVAAFRMRMVLYESIPLITGFAQETWVKGQRHNEREPAQFVATFRTLREVNLRLCQEMTEQDLEKVGQRVDRGPESLELMIRMLAGHDLSHINQIELYLMVIKDQQHEASH